MEGPRAIGKIRRESRSVYQSVSGTMQRGILYAVHCFCQMEEKANRICHLSYFCFFPPCGTAFFLVQFFRPPIEIMISEGLNGETTWNVWNTSIHMSVYTHSMTNGKSGGRGLVPRGDETAYAMCNGNTSQWSMCEFSFPHCVFLINSDRASCGVYTQTTQQW